MAGLKQHFPEFVAAGGQVDPSEIDVYGRIGISNPSISGTWFGTVSGTTSGTVALINALADHPRNVYYTISGITNGTYGGNFTLTGFDQFGQPVNETVSIATAVNGGTAFGTAIVAKVSTLAFATTASSGTWIGTANFGLGTLANGSAQSNWFGLLDKIGGTGDVKMITWLNNGTATTLNAGTNIGTLVQVSPAAFQGTSGVKVTDAYRVIYKSSSDNSNSGTIHLL